MRSLGNRRNLVERPFAKVVFIDPFRRMGVRIFGPSMLIEKGESSFVELYSRWEAISGELASRISHIVRIGAKRVLHLMTLPYDRGTTREEIISLYKFRIAELYS